MALFIMGTKATLEVEGKTLQVSNLEKVLYPKTGLTKGEVIDYYIRASKYILPHLKNRPLTLKRYPDGVEGKHFYEKDAPSHTPEWVETFAVPRKGTDKRKGDIDYVLINDLPSLVWAANLASLEMHVFLARAPKVKQPTSIVFDLDPGEPADVLDCAEVALWIRDLLHRMKLRSFVKSSGSKGLQLYIPLNSPVTYEKTQPFAKAIAEHLQAIHPDRVVADMAKKLRKEKVFIDWSQNSEFKTTICVYSLRAKREQPFVSMPFSWGEVELALKKQNAASFYYDAEAALERMEEQGDLFEPVLKLKQKVPARFEKLLEGETRENKGERLRGVGDRSLKAYEAKRDFSKTKEPTPRKVHSKKKEEGPLFVVQKHQASHLHFDFRLEMDGVLKSWAVPKGPPYERLEKRLAMWVEDHPLDYARFEGTIAPGNYGAGTVMVWDTGTYEVLDGHFKQGKLHLVLHGQKLKGEWILVRAKRTGEEEKQPWFLIKGGESMAPPRNENKSVLTKRTLEQIAKDNDTQWQSNRAAATKSRRARASKS